MTPHADPHATPLRAPLLDGFWLAGATLLLAVLLGQETLYNRDAHVMLLRLGQDGQWMHNHHFAFFPMCQLVHLLGDGLGWSMHTSARTASALSTAAGVLFVHLACRRLGMPRAEALLATGLVAACPAVLFFATVVEVHGPYFGAVGLACWATARLVAVPGVGAAVGLGAAIGAAYCAHATANLLPAVLLPLAAVRLWRGGSGLGLPRIAALCAVAAAVHGAIVLAVPAILSGLGLIVRTGDAFYIITEPLALLTAREGWVADLPRLAAIELHKEWLRPLAPLSVLFLAGLAHRRLRLQTALLVLGLLPYLALVVVILTPYPVNSERGAYLAALAWPAALIVVAALPRQGVAVAVALSLALAVHDIVEHDQPERSRAWAEGLAAVADGREPFVFVGDYPDLEAIHVRAPDVDFVFLGEWIRYGAALLPKIDELVARHRARGRPVYVTAGTMAWLEDAVTVAHQPAAAVVARHLRATYAMRPVAAAGFRGFALEPR